MRRALRVIGVVLVGCVERGASPGARPAPAVAPAAAPAEGPRADANAAPSVETPAVSAPPGVTPAPDLPTYQPMPTRRLDPASPPASPLEERGPTPEEERACAARGGKMQRICMMGELACVLRFRDGGKRCTDGAECAGRACLWEGEGPPPARATGGCVRTSDPCGCRATITRGVASPPMCTD